jgi:serine/threonine protein kinase
MIANRYRIGTEIRRGAFGTIYKGIYEKTQESVAIKLEHSNQTSLRHEIRMIQYLYMAGVKKIPSIYWFGTHETNPCVVMTLYECSLYDYRQRGQPTQANISKLMWLLIEIFEGVHKHWVVHRDIKPHNFMIKNGEVYLIDFGLATFYVDENGEHLPNHRSTTIIGSPYFTSLRIHEGHRYSRRDDLISLGYVWLFMMGVSWGTPPNIDSPTMPVDCSPLDLSYPVNQWLCQKKADIDPFMTSQEIRYYMDYVYELEYDETPKYTLLKLLFIPVKKG